ncbi:MFS transporter [Telmatospirillum siberiense]|uniref:MFS transporter n=1 Tax=Telmatospirillum siberiense TaxID=382514 RepID=A0A2N3PYX5_9PROT|nr:MFS transporter [Telmatospirillum siberiense]PKU25624.1 MFS transporter [Telmatospirillum siberiense]
MSQSKAATLSSIADTALTVVGKYRWRICALLFFSTTINYMDRMVFGLLKPTLMNDLHWTETEYGDIVAVFSLFYAFGYLGVGRFMDKIGVRIGLPGAVAAWSFFACLHAGMSSIFGFKVARAGLGLTEGGNFPASIKTVSEWFPAKERALATGIFNAGSNVGAVVAPILVPLLVMAWGWQAAFLVTGGIGFLWVIFWFLTYRKPEEHPKLSAAELAYIRSDPVQPTVKIPWFKLLGYRGTWANVAGTCFSAPVWWFYLNWVPGFLSKQYGVNLMAAMLPLVVIYCMADVGSIGGGWLSSHLIKRGVRTLTARKITFLVCGLCVVPVFMASQVSSMWWAVILIGIAASAHQGYSANVYTIVSDTMPQNAVGSVVGIGGFCAYIVGMFVSMGVGRLLDATNGNYQLLFGIASSLYLIGLVVMHLILPKAGSGKTPAGIEA